MHQVHLAKASEQYCFFSTGCQLTSRSQQSTQEIEKIIQAVPGSANDAVLAMEEGRDQARRSAGQGLANKPADGSSHTTAAANELAMLANILSNGLSQFKV